MDALMKLSREVQIVLGGGVVLLILSFLNWQGFGPYGWSEWHGFVGVLAGLLILAMLVWEAMRLMQVKIALGSLSPGLISVALALLVALFTVIAFLDKSDFRKWPAWIGLIVALVVGAAAVMRARGEGVQMPEMGGSSAGGSTGPSGGMGPSGGDTGSSRDDNTGSSGDSAES